MKKTYQKPYSRRISIRVILSALVLFLCGINVKAQRYVKDCDLTHTYSNTITTKTIPTYDNDYLCIAEALYHNNAICLSKYDIHGNIIFLKTIDIYSYPTISVDLKPISVAENPSDHSLAIVGQANNNGVIYCFLLKTDKDGNLLWYKQWTGVSANGVLFTHDPSYSNDIVVAATTKNSSGNDEATISIYDNSGTLIKTAMYSGSPYPIDVVDMAEIAGTGTYYLAVNTIDATGNSQPGYVQFNYALTSAGMHYYKPSVSAWSSPTVVAMVKYEPSGSNPCIYILGSCTNPFSTEMPFILKVDLVTNSINAVTFFGSSFNNDDQIIPYGLCLLNSPNQGLMICGAHKNNPAFVWETFVFTIDLGLRTASDIHLHPLFQNNYKSVTGTSDPNYYAIGGDGNYVQTITRTDQSGAVQCDNPTPFAVSATQGTTVTSGSLVTYSYTPSSATPAVTTMTVSCEGICGCEMGVSKNTFSEVIDGNFNTNDFLQADFDNSGQDIYVPSTIVDPSGNHNISVNQFHNDGYLAASYTYSITNVQHDALATKRCANGDIVTAGRRTDPSTSYPYLFIMRTNSVGTVSWYKAFPQSVSWDDYYVVITETTSGDIVVAGSSTLTNNIDLVRTDGAGTVRYHENVQVSAAGNPSELHPFIRAITATYDNGFVLVGSTGENNDFFGALVLKYDAVYSGAPFHTLSWSYIYRHKIPVYNLSVPADRSCAYASGVVQEPSNDLAIVGYVSNNDQFGNSATFENGFVIRLDPSGAFLNLGMFKPGKSTQFVRFNGISMAGLNYIITGQVYTPAAGTYQTMMMVTDPTMTISWANVYGSGTYNIGCSVFIDSHGFISAGVSNGNITPEQPNIIQTDYSGNLSPCSGAFSIGLVNDANDQPTYTESSIRVDGTLTDLPVGAFACYTPVDLCPSSTQPSRITGIGNNLMDPAGTIKMYPNPASSVLNIDLSNDEASKGSMQILDMQGRVVSENVISIAPGVNHTELDIARLKPGIYFVKVTDDKNKVYPVNKIEKY